MVLQVDAREHSSETAANNDNFSFFNDRIASEVGIGVGILVEFFELFLQAGELLQTIGAKTLELFFRVLGAKFFNRNLDAFVLLCHALLPLGADEFLLRQEAPLCQNLDECSCLDESADLRLHHQPESQIDSFSHRFLRLRNSMAPKLLRCSTHDDEIAVMKLKFHLD